MPDESKRDVGSKLSGGAGCLVLLGVAFEWLDRAIDARDQLMMPIKTYAFFDPICADPRFPALLRKMRLDE
jgi:hypothetical protein